MTNTNSPNKGGRGRKTPAAVRAMEGKNVPETVTVVGTIKRPDYVTEYAAEVWDRIVGCMPAGVFTPTDVDALASYCVACKTMRDTTMRILIEGEVLGGRVNPAYNAQNKARGQIIALGAQLGLTPIARENLAVPTAPGGDKWDGLLGVIEGGKPD